MYIPMNIRNVLLPSPANDTLILILLVQVGGGGVSSTLGGAPRPHPVKAFTHLPTKQNHIGQTFLYVNQRKGGNLEIMEG